MTEIPEHLLKRSRERRAQLKGESAGGDEAPASSEAATASAPAASSAPAAPMASGPAPRAAAKPAPPPAQEPKPDPPVVVAAKRRRRIPFWAAAALALLPVWGIMYARALTDEAEAAEGPLDLGSEVFAGSCASCHGAQGQGLGNAYQLSDEEALLTFPHIEDQLRFVYFGTDDYRIAGVQSYGDPDRPGGAHAPGGSGATMPGWGDQLPEYRILAAVCYTRYGIGDADPESEEFADEYAAWCAEDSVIFHGLETGDFDLTTLHEQELETEDGEPIELLEDGVGDEPREGSSAG